MLSRKLIALFCICSLCSCSDGIPEQQSKKYSGVYIDNSLRYGRIYKDPNGSHYNYRYMKTSIRNDSTIPLYINLHFSDLSFSPASVKGKTFRVFLLPENMTPESQNDDVYREQVMPFLDAGLRVPMTLQKTILPKESCTFNFGFLSDTSSHLDPLPITLFSKGHGYRFNAIPESAVAQVLSENRQTNLFLALDFSMASGDTSKPYALIPCGSLFFSHP